MSSWWSWFWPVNHLLVRSWAHLTTTVHVCGTGFQKTSDTLKENSRSTVSVRLVFELYLYINICFTSWILGFFLYPPSIYGFLVHFKASVLLFYLFSDKKPLISNFTQFKTSAPVFTESCIYNSQGAELNHGKKCTNKRMNILVVSHLTTCLYRTFENSNLKVIYCRNVSGVWCLCSARSGKCRM